MILKTTTLYSVIKSRFRSLTSLFFCTIFILINNYSFAQQTQKIIPMALCNVYSISPTTINAGRYGGTYSVSVTSQNNCTTYTVSESLTWVSYTKSGLTVTITISPNTGDARSGDVLIGGQTLTIYQACGSYPGNAGTISGSSSVCKGQTGVAYSVPAISGATGYVWTLPSGASIASGSNTNSITVNFSSSASSGTISVYGTNSCSSGLSSNFSMTVNSLPTPSASSNSPVCTYGTINLSSSGGTSYQWSGPNGFSSTQQNPSIANVYYVMEGTYYVTVTNAYGCSAQTSTSVSIYASPTVSITGGTSPLCYNTSPGTFTATANGGTGSYSYLWYKNGSSTGVTSSTYSPGNLTSSSTIYCAVTSGSCGTVNSNTISITVYGSLSASISGGSSPICYNTSPGTFTASGSGGTGSYSYLWYKNGSSTGVTSSTYSPGNLTSSSTIYCAVTSGSCGTVNSNTISTTVYGSLSASISGGSSPICYNTSPGTFTASGSGGTGSYSYLWYKNGASTGVTSQSYNPGALTSSSNIYCAVTSGSCGTVNSNTISITVYGNLSASISGGSSPICYNTSPGTFTATGSGGTGSYTYLWYKNGSSTGVTSQTYNPSALLSTSTFYCAVTSGSCGTVNTSTTTITVYSNLSASISGGTSPICSGTSPGTFTASGTGGTGSYTYLWYMNGASTGVTTNAYSPGNLTSTSSFYCAVTSGTCGTVNTSTTSITVNPLPNITDQPDDVTITSDESASFSIAATGVSLSFQWQYSPTGSDPWTNFGINSTDIIIPNDSILKTRLYRCVVTSACGTLYSNSAKIIVNVDYLEGSGVPDIERTLVTNTAVGTTAMSTSVSPMGGASINVPLFAPPGTAGMAPSISIVYNSQSGNGVLGYGWHLSGLSSISRTGKTMFHDGEVASVSISSSDKFMLNGERLMLAEGTYGSNNSVYHQESAPFSKIIAYSSGNEPSYFTENTKDGMTLEYGNSGNSRAYAVNSPYVYSWLLSKVTDVNGNYIKYNYSYEAGENWLRNIEYTGNTSQNLHPYDSIVFVYANRTIDKSLLYVAGGYLTRSKLLKQILIYCEGTVRKKYNLNYTNGLYSQLAEVTESNRTIDTTYNSVIFKWGNSGSLVEKYESQIFRYPEREGIETGDYNGDGKDDLVVWGNDSVDAGISFYEMIDGSFQRVFEKVYPMDKFTSLMNKDKFNSVTDMNGDGIDDLIMFSDDSLFVFMGNSSDQDVFDDEVKYPITGVTNFFPGDFNGDGIGELMLIGSGYSYIRSIYDNQTWNVSLPASSYQKFVDFDGDGKTDLLTLIPGGYILTRFIYDSSTHQYSTVQVGMTYTSSLLNDSKNAKMFEGDYNGDGNTDFLIKGSPDWYIMYSSGTQYINNTSFTCSVESGFDPFTPANGHAVFVRDINSDGKSDIIEIRNHYTSGNIDGLIMNYHLSKGMEFKVETNQWIHSVPLVTSSDFLFGTYYSDGQLDCLYQMYRSFKLKENDRTNQIVAVLDGLNHKTEFEYGFNVAPSAELSRPSLDTLIYRPFKQFIVNSVVSTGSDNNPKKLEYSYSNPVLHLGGKGFLGFANVTSTDAVTKVTSTSKSNVNERFVYTFPEQQIVKDETGSTLSEKYFSNANKSYTYGSYFGYLSKVIGNDILHGNTDTTFYYYDSYGNDTLTILKQNGELTTTTSRQFIQKNTWCPARVAATSQTKTSGNQPSYQTSSVFRYDNFGRLSSTNVFANLQDSIHVDVAFNNYGNLSSKDTKLANGSRRSESFSYDSKQRYTTTLTRGTLSFSYLYDATTGNITKETAPNGLETNYTYDGFGRQTRRSVSENQYISTAYSWSIDTTTGAIYYIQQKDAESTGKAWYNNLGQEIKTQTTGFSSSTTINKDRIYSKRGLVVQESKPYFTTPDPTWNTFAYDSINRIVSSVNNGATASFSYSSNNITSTLQVSGGNRVSTVSYNGLGQVSSTTRSNKSLDFEYDNNGKLINANPPASGSTVSYDYDSRSMLTQENDPDRGNSDYEYNSLGELIGFKTANGDKDSIIYDHIGRDSIRVRDNGQTKYSYYTSGIGKGKLSEISSPSGYKKYSYDIYGNVIRECDSIPSSENFSYSYEYNEYGKLSKMTYPGGFAVTYEYNSNGFLLSVRKADDNSIIWKCFSADANSNITEYQLSPGNITVNKTFDSNGYLTQIKTDFGSTPKQWLKYSFDPTTGDLSMRKDSLKNITESFGYDLFDQLKWSKVTGMDSLKMDYDDIGNITSKSDVGDYYYNSTRIHAVDSISGSQYPGRQNIEYNFFNKPVYIADAEDSLNYVYNVLDNRIKATLYGTGGLVKTTWYAGLYEKTIENSITKHYYYINGPDGPIALAIQTGSGTPELYYLCKDHLGSITGVMESDGDLVEEYNYDAWGRRRSPKYWSYDSIPMVTFTQHGFTGHEHLDMFNLINMNGRIYDSEIARFVSPDPIIQDPYNILSYNRYSYCLNNPLKYTDPSGYAALRTFLMDTYDYDGGGFWYRGTYYSYSSNAGYGGQGGFVSSGGPGGNQAVYQKVGYEQTTDYYTAYKNKDGNWVTTNYIYSETKQWNEWELVGNSSGQGGPGWEAYVGTAGAIAGEMYYSKTFGTWMGKDFKLYRQTWGGNGFTGGKNKFGKTTYNGFKWAGRLLGAYSGYKTIEQRVNRQIGTGWMLAELGTNAVSAFGGLYGAAWGIGWEAGRFITNMEGYQEAKFNFWYNRWENQIGPPSLSNEALWYYFFQNYEP